jgi:hypothetical protein
MTTETSCLTTYIASIHYRDDFLSRRGKIFDYEITHDSPTLRPGRINRILMYPGPFNPPHRGLFELLRGRGVNIIADRYLRHTKLIKIQIRSLNRLPSVVCGTWLRVCASAPAAGTPDLRGAGLARTAPSSPWPPASTHTPSA